MIIAGVVAAVCAVIGSVVIPNVKDKQLCENVCVPLPSDPEWLQNTWISNTNASRNPLEYMKFTLFNITNPAEVYNGSKPVVSQHGPFVYQIIRTKYDIKYSDDNEKVSFKELKQYHFRPEMSNNLTEDDVFTSITLPITGSLNLVYHMSKTMVWPTSANIIPSWCYGDPNDPDTPPQPSACLFTNRTAKQIIWGYDSYDLASGNSLFFGAGSRFFDPHFSLWFNDTNTTEKDYTDTNGHNFGLGGECVVANASFFGQYPTPLCKDPESSNLTLTTTIYTGHNSDSATDGLKNVNQYVMWRGNTTFDTWAEPVSVKANDQYQFQTDLDTDDELSVLDPKLMRPVKLSYKKTVSLLDVDMYRYTPKNLLDGDTTFDYCLYVNCLHGTCDSENKGKCKCDDGFMGAECDVDIRTSANATCVSGNSTCGHGKCGNETNTCECEPNWYGDKCDVSPCASVDCGRHGACDSSNGQCQCDDEWFGATCLRWALPGTVDISQVSATTYGSNTPVKLSEIYMRGVADTTREQFYDCINCPNVTTLTQDDTGVYVDIEPNTGKTLRGARRGQLNAFIGQDHLYGKCSDVDPHYTWSCVPEGLYPVVFFEEVAAMSEENSKIVKDGLSSLTLANSSLKACQYGLPIIAVIFLLIGGYLCKTWMKGESAGTSYRTF